MEYLLDKCKAILRIDNNASNDEIESLIKAAQLDLIESGVLKTIAQNQKEPRDDLVDMAIRTYVKANYGYNNPDYEKLTSSYEKQRAKLKQSEKYTVAVPTVTV